MRLLVDRDTYQVVDTYRYAPFGNLLAGGSSDNTRRFTGEREVVLVGREKTRIGSHAVLSTAHAATTRGRSAL